MISSVRNSSSPPQLNTAFAQPSFPFLSRLTVCQKFLEANEKSFSIAFPNTAYSCIFAAITTTAVAPLPVCCFKRLLGCMRHSARRELILSIGVIPVSGSDCIYYQNVMNGSNLSASLVPYPSERWSSMSIGSVYNSRAQHTFVSTFTCHLDSIASDPSAYPCGCGAYRVTVWCDFFGLWPSDHHGWRTDYQTLISHLIFRLWTVIRLSLKTVMFLAH